MRTKWFKDITTWIVLKHLLGTSAERNWPESQDPDSTPNPTSDDFPSDSGCENWILSKETWFSLLREWKSWKLQWEQQFLPPTRFSLVRVSVWDLVADGRFLVRIGAGVSQSSFVADFYFWKILEQMQACSSAQRCHDGRSHALLEYVGLAAVVWRIVCLSKRRGNVVPPPSRAIRMRRIFPSISCAFLRDSGTPIFQAPKRRRKICGKWAQKWAQNWAQKSAHQKSAQKWAQKSAHQKWAQKSAHQKWAQKWAQKSAHQKSAQKTGLNIRFVWMMEARRKKNTKKICAKLAQNPSQDKEFWGWGWGSKVDPQISLWFACNPSNPLVAQREFITANALPLERGGWSSVGCSLRRNVVHSKKSHGMKNEEDVPQCLLNTLGLLSAA